MTTEKKETSDIEVVNMLNEVDKINISKIEVLVDVLEALKPSDEQTFGETTRYKSVLDEIDSGIVINKLKELIKKL